MGILVLDCPHCGTKKVTFSIWGRHLNKLNNRETALGSNCSSCHKSVMSVFQTQTENWDFTGLPGNLLEEVRIRHVATYPALMPLEAPANTPTPIAQTFLEAAANKRDQRPSSACAMYRRTMELALKAFSPDVEAWKLEKRIDKLASEHRITPELQKWAHELRLDGNDAMHEPEEATMEMAEGMHSLCWFLLTYLYTLPAQVEAARARRETGDPAVT